MINLKNTILGVFFIFFSYEKKKEVLPSLFDWFNMPDVFVIFHHGSIR